MWNKFLKLFLAAALLCISIACSKQKYNPPFSWGKSDYYEKFLWKECKLDTLTRTLVFEFNDDAKHHMTKPIVLGLYKKDAQDEFVEISPNEAESFIDGVHCENNEIRVYSNCERVRLGILFKPNAENKMHYWYIKVKDYGGLERINDVEVTKDNKYPILRDIQVEKHKVANPLGMGVSIFGLFIVAFLLIWFIIIKPSMYPKFKVKGISLAGPGAYYKRIDPRKYIEVILCDKNESQSILNSLFIGKKLFIVNSIWEGRTIFKPKDKKSIKIEAAKAYYIESKLLKVGEQYHYINDNNKNNTIINVM